MGRRGVKSAAGLVDGTVEWRLGVDPKREVGVSWSEPTGCRGIDTVEEVGDVDRW